MIEIIEKKSKFITYAFSLNKEEDALQYLSDLREEHSKATHICYAYNYFGHSKYSDDNEPSGTAGSPILNVIMKNNLNNTLIAVVRYFGGIKLGAGGLTRAYSNCASEIIKRENIKNLDKCLKVSFYVDFNEQKLIENLSHLDFVRDVRFEYLDKVVVNITLNEDKINELMLIISNKLNRNIDLINSEVVYV